MHHYNHEQPWEWPWVTPKLTPNNPLFCVTPKDPNLNPEWTDFPVSDCVCDQARVALSKPWWTLGHPFEDIVNIAGFAGKETNWIHQNLKGEMAIKEAQTKGNMGPAGIPVKTPEVNVALGCILSLWENKDEMKTKI